MYLRKIFIFHICGIEIAEIQIYNHIQQLVEAKQKLKHLLQRVSTSKVRILFAKK